MTSSDFASFLEAFLQQAEPLSREVNLAYWTATVSGREADFDKLAELQVRLQKLYSNPKDFERIKTWHLSGSGLSGIDARQVDILYNAFLRNQISPDLNERITKLSTRIENQFNVYRAKVNGKALTGNDILKILKESNDSALRKNVWLSGKEVGSVVHDDLLTLVKLRNEAAEILGYSNYYSMSLALNEQNEEEVIGLFDELEKLTREPFAEMKAVADERMTERYGIATTEIRPWHYEDPFSQEAPRVFNVDLDRYFKDHDVLDLVARYFEGIGLEVRDILARSDLYEKRGKDQHAFCTDIDRKGDIRILANIKNDETWTGTMLHELGHAVHDKYIDPDLPYLVRQEAHIFTTEAIAMLFGRLSKDPNWIQEMGGISNEEKVRISSDLGRNLRHSQLMFARWSQVMMHFERELYTNPGQNLNELWWALVERFQMITPPEEIDRPHWATKTHIVTVPVYYHNYLLGEVLASQIDHFIRENVLPPGERSSSFAGCVDVGTYLTEKIFAPGAKLRWDEMIASATGEPLTPKYFAEQFVH